VRKQELLGINANVRCSCASPCWWEMFCSRDDALLLGAAVLHRCFAGLATLSCDRRGDV